MSMPTFHLAPDLAVSRLCFGTMTMGEQSRLPESLRLLDAAFDAGVNFFDSAEMYPVPQRSETHGRSEEILGRWLRARWAPRDSVVLATKVAGPSGEMTWIRGGPASLDSRNIAEAIDGSYVPMFGETEYDPSHQYMSVPMEEQLLALGRAIDAGKIRYIGLSNETPYGLMKFLQLSRDSQLHSKILTVQNSYNLLCRNFDAGLAECCHHERISLLAYSPMAMGILSGKYYSSDDGGPPDARMNLFKGRYSEGESRYNLQNPKMKAAVKEYVKISAKHGISPAILAVAFVLRHPLVSSAVFGATEISQLTEVLQATRIHLSEEIVAEINEVHARYPNPCP
uniref:NADP-dependent oxidoreductase domain-containing protein n=1 Tax=Oryza nivara TaxID=4536 RepID=A0A0E0J4Y9_ORYNI